jgi:hypothetical protein
MVEKGMEYEWNALERERDREKARKKGKKNILGTQLVQLLDLLLSVDTEPLDVGLGGLLLGLLRKDTGRDEGAHRADGGNGVTAELTEDTEGGHHALGIDTTHEVDEGGLVVHEGDGGGGEPVKDHGMELCVLGAVSGRGRGGGVIRWNEQRYGIRNGEDVRLLLQGTQHCIDIIPKHVEAEGIPSGVPPVIEDEDAVVKCGSMAHDEGLVNVQGDLEG